MYNRARPLAGMRDVRMTDVRHNARTDERPDMYRGRRILFSESSAGAAAAGAVATPAAAAVAPASRECASVERRRPHQRRQDALHVQVRARSAVPDTHRIGTNLTWRRQPIPIDRNAGHKPRGPSYMVYNSTLLIGYYTSVPNV